MPFILESSFQKSGSKCSKEDSVQIPTQRSRIPRFIPDGPAMRPGTHQCPEVSNSSRLHPFGRHGNTFGRSSVFGKKSNFLLRHKYGKTATSVRTTGQYRPDTILDKARCWEELQSSGRYGNTVQTWSLLWYLRAAEVQSFEHRPDVVLIMVFTCSISAIIRTLFGRGPDMVLREARYGKSIAQCPFRRPQLASDCP